VAVGGHEDAVSGPVFPVFFLQQLTEEEKGDGRLRGVAGLGDDIDRKVPVPDIVQQLRHGVGGEGVAGEKDLRGLPGQQVIVRGGQQLQQGAGAEVGPADADDDEHIGLLADDLRGLQQALDLLAVIGLRQFDPTGELPPQAVASLQ